MTFYTKSNIRGKMSPKKVNLAKRRKRALELRSQGFQYSEIAEIITKERGSKYSYTQAYHDCMAAMDEIKLSNAESIHALRGLELVRYDRYLTKLEPAIDLGDVESIKCAIKISETRSKLIGLFAPVEIRIEQIVKTRLEEEFQYFFESVFENELIPQDVKDMLLEACNNMSREVPQLAEGN